MKTIKEMLECAAAKYGKNIAVQYIDEKKRIVEKTYEDLKRDSELIAYHLSEKGYKKTNIAILSDNSYEWMISFFGIILSGNVAIPLNDKLPVEELNEILKRAGVKTFLYHKDRKALAEQIKAENGIKEAVCMNEYPSFETEAFAAYEVPDAADAAECCMIMFTSGTTGGSKGVMLSQKSLLTDAVSASEQSGCRHDNTHILSVLPMFHIFALSVDVLWSVVQGFPIAINTSFPEIMKNAKRFGVTRICMVPMMAEYIYNSMVQLLGKQPQKPKRAIAEEVLGTKIKYLVFGGAYLEPEFRSRLASFGLEVKCGYGMTETSCVISTEEGVENKEGTVGHILDCNQVKIVNGEICVRGDNVMMGYYQDDEATGEVMEQGWMRTGDIGYMDEENYLYITGKKKNVIITASGENVSPEELEKKLLVYDLVKEVIVYQKKNQIAAEIYPDADYMIREKLDNAEAAIRRMIEEVNAKNPSFKHIHSFTTRDTELEKTSTMKIKREKYYYG